METCVTHRIAGASSVCATLPFVPVALTRQGNSLEYQEIQCLRHLHIGAMHCLLQYKTALATDISTARFRLTLAALQESTCAVIVVCGFSKDRLSKSAFFKCMLIVRAVLMVFHLFCSRNRKLLLQTYLSSILGKKYLIMPITLGWKVQSKN